MPTLTIETAVRRARIIAGCFLVYLALLPFFLERFVPATSSTPDRTLFAAICIVCVVEIGVTLAIRRRTPLVREEIAPQEAAPSATRKWLKVQMMSYAIAISVALYGVVFRVLGAELMITVPFYAVALVLLLFWWPRRSGG